MQSRFTVAFTVALALSGCGNADEAAAPAMEQAREAAGAAEGADGDDALPLATDLDSVAATSQAQPPPAEPAREASGTAR